MKNYLGMSISIKLERERQVDKLDKFFIVDFVATICGRETACSSGWIEKEFDEKVFINKCPMRGIKKVSVRRQFDNEKDYEKYKKDEEMGF